MKFKILIACRKLCVLARSKQRFNRIAIFVNHLVTDASYALFNTIDNASLHIYIQICLRYIIELTTLYNCISSWIPEIAYKINLFTSIYYITYYNICFQIQIISVINLLFYYLFMILNYVQLIIKSIWIKHSQT